MRIKNVIAGLMAGVLMLCNMSAVCYAAGPDTVPATDTTTAVAEDADKEVEDSDGNAEPADGETSPISLPNGFTIGEDGSFSFSLDDWDLSMFTGFDEDGDADTTPVRIGTVNVNSNTYLNLRSGGGMEYEIIGHLLRGTEVKVIGESGDWYEVIVPERTGYVHKNYLDVVESGTASGGTQELTDSDMQMLMMFLYLMMSGINNTEPAESPSNTLTPDGNLTLVDDYAENYEDGSGKQFITLTTKAGNVFYLVIDRDDKGEQNVHFMNLVDERDLLCLMDEEEAAEYATDKTETPPPVVTEEPDPDETEPTEIEPEKKSGVNPAPVILLVVVLLGGGGFFAFTKLKGKKKQQEQAKPDPDADYLEDDDEEFELPEDIPLDGDDEDESEYYADDNEPV